ncbi:MAG: four helix bundle protein, partial [Actinomycetota bacterium]|nr:four helix bundle protein [Actinomycetota bacterium]
RHQTSDKTLSRREKLRYNGRTTSFPPRESFGLTAQMRRAANSIGANIAEGCAREGGRDRARFFETSNASAHELEHHLILAADIGLIDDASAERLIAELEEIRKMIVALRLRSLSESAI